MNAHLLESLAYESYFTAQIDRALAACAAALAIWSQRGDARKEGENRCHLAGLLWAQGRIADAEREAETAVALMERVEPGPELAMDHGTLARLRGSVLRDDPAIRLGENAIALAERVGAASTRIDALTTMGEVRLARGEISSGQDRLDLSLRLSTDAGLDEFTARTHISLRYGFAECGIDFCAERAVDLPLQHMTALLANVHVGLGQWDQAKRLSAAVLGTETVPQARASWPSSPRAGCMRASEIQRCRNCSTPRWRSLGSAD